MGRFFDIFVSSVSRDMELALSSCRIDDFPEDGIKSHLGASESRAQCSGRYRDKSDH